jgi:hypothetical protein
MIRRVTFCTMLQTDGHIQVYGIFRGKLQGADRPKSEQYINLHQAVRMGVESSTLGPTEFDYFPKPPGALRPTSIRAICVERLRREYGAQHMRCRAAKTWSKLCQQCGSAIEEGRLRNQPPIEAK